MSPFGVYHWSVRLRAIVQELDLFYEDASNSPNYTAEELNRISEAIQRLEIEQSDIDNKAVPQSYPTEETPNGGTWQSHL